MNSVPEDRKYPNCRRVSQDPRKLTVRTVIASMYKKRRRTERRAGLSDDNTYVDIHGPYIAFATIAVMLFCVMDAVFTLMLIERGSSELNPLLAWMLEIDIFWFFTVKYTITAICVLWVVMHKHFNFFGMKGRHVIAGVLIGYMALISYQLSMLTMTI